MRHFLIVSGNIFNSCSDPNFPNVICNIKCVVTPLIVHTTNTVNRCASGFHHIIAILIYDQPNAFKRGVQVAIFVTALIRPLYYGTTRRQKPSC